MQSETHLSNKGDVRWHPNLERFQYFSWWCPRHARHRSMWKWYPHKYWTYAMNDFGRMEKLNSSRNPVWVTHGARFRSYLQSTQDRVDDLLDMVVGKLISIADHSVQIKVHKIENEVPIDKDGIRRSIHHSPWTTNVQCVELVQSFIGCEDVVELNNLNERSNGVVWDTILANPLTYLSVPVIHML